MGAGLANLFWANTDRFRRTGSRGGCFADRGPQGVSSWSHGAAGQRPWGGADLACWGVAGISRVQACWVKSQFSRGIAGIGRTLAFSSDFRALGGFEQRSHPACFKRITPLGFFMGPRLSSPFVAVSMSEWFLYPASLSSGKKKINTTYRPDPWQKFLSASRPKNSSPSEQLLGLTHEHSVAHASQLFRNPECSVQPTASVAIFTQSDVVPGPASFTPALKIHLKCYLL